MSGAVALPGLEAGPARAAQVLPLVAARGLDRVLDYAVPEELSGAAVPGALVACPLGPRRILGVVVGRDAPTHEGRLQPIAGVVEAPPVAPDLLELAGWMARYYVAPTATCLRLVLPPGGGGALRRAPDGSWRLAPPPSGPREVLTARLLGDPAQAGSARRREVAEALRAAGGTLAAAELVRRAATTMPTLRAMGEAGVLALEAAPGAAADAAAPRSVPPELTPDQARAVAALVAAIDGGGGAHLLHGVTGSGKTEVYLHAIEAARERGKGAIVLVPEIALTPQLLGRLRGRLGPGVAVWHSALTPAQRAAEHRRVREGEADVVLGARSAVFAPVPRLGLIVVDEEHDGSYKQDSSPRYDARQVAALRGSRAGAAVVYGSATPRPETWKALPRLSLPCRADGSPLPAAEIVDMRRQGAGPVSRPLASALHDAMLQGRKAIVLATRRGFSLMALCRECGWMARCPDCDVALVHHDRPARLVCHHCGREEPVPGVCPSCHAAAIVRQGTGAQGVERALARLVPMARLVRMDASSASGRGAVARLLAEFARPGPAILLGTQMVAKGHDLPDVTVAAVVDADAPLQFAGFRSEERAFALIVQIAGRAGRRGEPARVFVQAHEPEARVVQLGARHAVEEFLDGELARRWAHDLPPYRPGVRIVVAGAAAGAVDRCAEGIAADLRAAAPAARVRGPAPLHRLRGRTRAAILLAAERASLVTPQIRSTLAAWEGELRRGGVRAGVDVDPQET
ncbi:MAG: primosomal protein N' [Thermoleophilia bacterium]